MKAPERRGALRGLLAIASAVLAADVLNVRDI
jgi:hypothetical protein